MFKPVRVVATIVFLAMIVLIFVAAFVLGNGTLCISKPLPSLPLVLDLLKREDVLVFVVLEYLAFLWYTLSYIPYARSAVLKVVGMS